MIALGMALKMGWKSHFCEQNYPNLIEFSYSKLEVLQYL